MCAAFRHASTVRPSFRLAYNIMYMLDAKAWFDALMEGFLGSL